MTKNLPKQTFMIPQFPFYRQLGELDCGVTCLKMITDYFGGSVPCRIFNQKIPMRDEGVSLNDISNAATNLGLKTMGVKVTYDRLVEEIPTPCIAFWKQQHFVVIYQVNEEYLCIADPATRGIFMQSRESFLAGWVCDTKQQAGVLLLFETTPEFRRSTRQKTLEISS